MKSSTVQIDGWLYFLTAVWIAAQSFLSSEETFKYVNPVFLYWLKFFIDITLAGFNGLKAFRSMTFGRYVQEQQGKQDATPPTEPPKTP